MQMCIRDRHRTLPWLENRESGGDKVKDFLGKGHHEAARQGEEPLRALGRIVALEMCIRDSLLAAGILGSVLVLQRPDTSMVEVVRDGQVLYQFDLEMCIRDRSYIVEHSPKYTAQPNVLLGKDTLKK